MARPMLGQLTADRVISLIYHPMNLLDAISATAYSTRAAAASGAAADHGMFRAYADALFVAQPPEDGSGPSDGQLVELGHEVGLTDPGFAETIRCGRYLPWPPYGTERAVERGVAGTPSVSVRGVAARPGPILMAVESAVG